MSWKEKLHDADEFSDIKLADKNAAWEKLHSRMQEQPKKAMPFWYWVAAAAVLIAIVLPFSMHYSNPDVVKTVAKTQEELLSPQKKNDSVKDIQPVIVNNEPTVITNKIESSIIKKEKAINNSNQLSKQMIVINKLDEPVLSSTNSIIVDSSMIQKLPTIVTVTAPKKKLKVVHVNELGEPIAELNPRNSTDDYSVIQFGIIKQQSPGNAGTNPVTHNSIFSKQKNVSN